MQAVEFIKTKVRFCIAAVICCALFKVEGEWVDDLIWCPSQCYLHFSIKGQCYVLYLRWRHADPWSASVIKTDHTFALNGEASEWKELDIKYFSDSDNLDKLKRHCTRKAILKVAHCI